MASNRPENQNSRIISRYDYCISGDPGVDPAENYRNRMEERKECGEFTVDAIKNYGRGEQPASYELYDGPIDTSEIDNIIEDPFDPNNQ